LAIVFSNVFSIGFFQVNSRIIDYSTLWLSYYLFHSILFLVLFE